MLRKEYMSRSHFFAMFISDVNVILPRGQDAARIVQEIFCRSIEFSEASYILGVDIGG